MVVSKKNTCPGCNLRVTGADQALQCEGNCLTWYHISCVGVDDEDYQNLVNDPTSTWLCENCLSPSSQYLKDAPSGKNSSSQKKGKVAKQTGNSAQPQKGRGNPGQSQKAKTSSQKEQATLDRSSSFTVRVEDLNPTVQPIGKSINYLVEASQDLRASMAFLSSQYDEFLKQLTVVQEENRKMKQKMEANKKVVKNLAAKNKSLKNKVDRLEQRMIENELEINGVPQSENENCVNIFQTICAKIHCPIAEGDVIEARRLTPMNSTKPGTNRKMAAAPIVVTMAKRSVCQKILAAKKTDQLKKGNDASDCPTALRDIGFSQDGRFFINERLTHTYRHLFWLARKTKDIGFKYCWVKNGTIYIRKTENTEAIPVYDEDDIPSSPKQTKTPQIQTSEKEESDLSDEDFTSC